MLFLQVENPEVVEAIQARVDGVTEDVARLHLDIPEEFVAWQTEDMKRQYPNLEESGEAWLKAWMTRIWPRSRDTSNQQKKRYVRRGRRPLRPSRGSMFGTRNVGGSARPILRLSLFNTLRARMVALFDKVSFGPN